MRLRIPTFLVAILLLALPLAGQTLDQVLAQHFEARGGEARIRAVTSLRMEGKSNAGDPWELPFVLMQKRPGRIRTETKMMGQIVLQGFDGKNAWSLDPTSGKKDPEIQGEEVRRDQELQADIDGPLLDWKAKDHKVELVGKDDVEGTETWKIRILLKGGDIMHAYLDTDSLMIIKTEMKQIVRGTEREFETYLGDYRKEGGVYYACCLESGSKGSLRRSKTVIGRIQVNPRLDVALFEIPKPTAPAAKR